MATNYSNTSIFNLLDGRSLSSSAGSQISQYCMIKATQNSKEITGIGSNTEYQKFMDNSAGTVLNTVAPNSKIKEDNKSSNAGTVSLKNVYGFLPLPENFSFAVHSNWNEQDLGIWSEAAVKETMDKISELSNSTGWKDLASKTIDVVTAAGGNALASMIVAGKQKLMENAISWGSGENKSATVQQMYKLSGSAINPNKQLYFQGMNFESFSLDFNIAPLSPTDNENLQAYIKELMAYSIPKAYKTAGQNYFEYPNLVQVVLKSNGKTIFSEESLAITSVSCTPSMYTHADGNSINYKLTVEFKETILRTRENVYFENSSNSDANSTTKFLVNVK